MWGASRVYCKMSSEFWPFPASSEIVCLSPRVTDSWASPGSHCLQLCKEISLNTFSASLTRHSAVIPLSTSAIFGAMDTAKYRPSHLSLYIISACSRQGVAQTPRSALPLEVYSNRTNPFSQAHYQRKKCHFTAC